MKIADGAYNMIDTRDWLLGDADQIRRLKAFAPTSNYDYERNQNMLRDTIAFCTGVAPMSIILSYKNLSWTDDQWQHFFYFARDKYGYEAGEGNYIQLGVKVAVDYWNTNHPDDPLVYYRMDWDSEEFHQVLDMGYQLVVGGKYSSLYTKDAEDGRIDDLPSWKNKRSSYGHAFRIRKRDGEYKYTYNYDGYPFNYHTISKELIPAVKLGTDQCGHFPSVYVITSGKMITETNNEKIPFAIAKTVKIIMEANSKTRHDIENSDIPRADKDRIQAILHNYNKAFREIL